MQVSSVWLRKDQQGLVGLQVRSRKHSAVKLVWCPQTSQGTWRSRKMQLLLSRAGSW